MPHPSLRRIELRDAAGQTMTEMGVVLALVVLLVMVAVAVFGDRLGELWSNLSSTLPGG